MFDHTGKPIRKQGLHLVPYSAWKTLPVGDPVQGMDNDRAARQLAEERAEQKRLADQEQTDHGCPSYSP